LAPPFLPLAKKNSLELECKGKVEVEAKGEAKIPMATLFFPHGARSIPKFMCARVSKSMPSNNEMVPMHFEYKNMNGRKMSRRCPPWAKTKARREDSLFTPIMDTYVVGWGGLFCIIITTYK